MNPGSIEEYNNLLESYTKTEEFAGLADDKAKAEALINFRDTYKSNRVVDEPSAEKIDGFTTIESDYFKNKRFTPSVDDLVGLGVNVPDFSSMSTENAIRSIEASKEDALAKADSYFDSVYVEDYKYGIETIFDDEARKVRGRNTGKAADLGYRAIQGASNRLLQSAGLGEEAERWNAKLFPENPEFDEDFSSDLATGAGDFLVTMGAVLGATAMTGGNVYAGAGAGLYINSVGKYSENYKKVMRETGNELAAHDAGVASFGGAALESMGDALLANRFRKILSPSLRKSFTEAPDSAAKAEVVRGWLKDKSFSKRFAKEFAIQGGQEGVFEALGSYVSGVGGSMATGLDLTPTPKELLREGAVGAVLGGAMGGGAVTLEAALTSKGEKVDMAALRSRAKEALASKDPTKIEQAANAIALTEDLNKIKQSVDLTPTTTSIADDGSTVFKKGAVVFDERKAKIHDYLVGNLTAQLPLDEVDILPKGRGKGARNNPAANEIRTNANAETQAIDEDIKTLLPVRSSWQAQVDKVGKEVGIPQVDLDLYKRTVDAVTLTAMQNGVEPEFIYGNMSFEVGEDLNTNVSNRRFRELDNKFSDYKQLTDKLTPEDELGRLEAAREVFGDLDKNGRLMSVELGKLEREYQDEKSIRDLIASQPKEMLEQAKLPSAREHFVPQLFDKLDQPAFKSREILVDMPIDDFLKLADPIRDDQTTYSNIEDGVVTSGKHAEALKQIVEGGTKFDELPFLQIDEYSKDGPRVSGHEGRHRAKALKALGYDTMPVVWRSGKIRWSEQSDPNKFDYVDEASWPAQLRSEDLSETVDYPVGRDGTYRQPTDKLNQEDMLNQYAGNKASITPTQELNRQAAIKMLEAGKTSEEIRLATGWFPGDYDGKLRWEIDDSGAELTDEFSSMEETKIFGDKKSKLLSEVLDHKDLFVAYPELADITVIRRKGFFDIFGALQGSFDPATNVLNVTPNAKEPLSTMLHEIQHWIQSKEGFARGGNEESSIDALNEKQKNDLIAIINDKADNLAKEKNEKILDLEKEIDLIDFIDADRFAEVVGRIKAAGIKYTEARDLGDEKAKQEALEEKDAAKTELKYIITDEEDTSDSEFLSRWRANPQLLNLWASAVAISDIYTVDDLSSYKKDDLLRIKKDAEEVNLLVKNGINDAESLKKAVKKFDLGYELYRTLAGEIEARDTQARQNLTKEQRLATKPYSSENISKDDALVTFREPGDANSKLGPESSMLSGANVRRAMDVLFGQDFYSGSFSDTTLRELTQNGIDAVNKSHSDNVKFVGYDTDKVTIDGVEHGITTFLDNGSGMNAETALTKFMPAFVTGKEEGGTAGGFGLAKIVLLGGADYFQVVTRAKLPNGFTQETIIQGTGEKWKEFAQSQHSIPDFSSIKGTKDFAYPTELNTKSFDFSGIKFTVSNLDTDKMQYEGRVPATGTFYINAYKLDGNSAKKSSPYGTPPTIYGNKDELVVDSYVSRIWDREWSSDEVFNQFGYIYDSARGRYSDYILEYDPKDELNISNRISDLSEYDDFELPNVKGAKVKIYVHKNEKRSAYSWGVDIPVLNNGIQQFTAEFKPDISGSGSVNIPEMSIEVSPTVSVNDVSYPYSKNRDNLTGDAFVAVKSFLDNLVEIEKKAQIEELKSAQKSSVVKLDNGEEVKVFGMAKSLTDQDFNLVVNSPSIKKFAEYSKRVDAILKPLTKVLGDFEITGISIHPQSYGFRFGAGNQKSDGKIYLNPLIMLQGGDGAYQRSVSPSNLYYDENKSLNEHFRDVLFGVLLHEVSHQISFTEGEGHARAMTFLAGQFSRYKQDLDSAFDDLLTEEDSKNILNLGIYIMPKLQEGYSQDFDEKIKDEIRKSTSSASSNNLLSNLSDQDQSIGDGARVDDQSSWLNQEVGRRSSPSNFRGDGAKTGPQVSERSGINTNVSNINEGQGQGYTESNADQRQLTDELSSTDLNTLNQDQTTSNQSQPTDKLVSGQSFSGNFWHGGTYDGNGAPRMSKEGSLGAGFYLGPQKTAAGYVNESGSTMSKQKGQVTELNVRLARPLVVRMGQNYMSVEAMIFEQLGMSREKAMAKADKIVEEKGYIGKHFQAIGKKLGYDGIVLTDQAGNISEIVAWNPYSVTTPGLEQKAKGKIAFIKEGKQAPIKTAIKDFDSSLQAIIKIMRNGGDISTFHHETLHFYHRSGLLAKLLTPEQLIAFEQAAKVKDGVWARDNYELVARTYESWLRTPKKDFEKQVRVPPLLQKAFERISDSIRKLYQNLRLSGLPYQDVKGVARPQIAPAFRLAFEALYNYEGQLTNESPAPASTTATPASTTTPTTATPASTTIQNTPQLPSVTPQLTPEGGAVTSPQPTVEATEAQLNEYELDENDKFNIKAIDKIKDRGSSSDANAIKLFKDIITLNNGLKKDPDDAGLFYAALDNYIRARKLVKPEDYQLLSVNPKAYTDENYSEFIRKAGDPAYTDQLTKELQRIRKEALDRWMADYRSKNAKYLKNDADDLTKSELQKIVQEAKREEQKAKAGDGDTERRTSIEDNVKLLQASIPSDLDALLAELQVPDNFRIEAIEYLGFLQNIEVTSKELSDSDALELQINLDAILNNSNMLGLENFAKHKAKAWLGGLNGQAKFRDPYSKWGLIGMLNRVSADGASKLMTRLGLTSTNLERIAGNQEAKDQILSMGADYAVKEGMKQAKVNEWSKFMETTRNKWWPDKTIGDQDMHIAGMISKIMQAPLDADQETRDTFVKESSEQMLLGINQMIKRGGNQAYNGNFQLQLFNKLMEDLPKDFTQDQFIANAETKFPAHLGYINDMVSWLENNVKEDARFVSQGLFGTPFREFMHYLPTRQVPLAEEKFSSDNLEIGESAIGANYGDGGIFVSNVITTDRADSLKSRKGYVKKDFTFATNLENTLDRGVKAILNDVYTGFERKKLSFLLSNNSNLRAQLEDHIGNGVRVSHLLQVMHDMVSTDLNEHAYVNGVEALFNRIKRNIAPALLSSLHQPITQFTSQASAHLGRRGMSFLPHYVDALKLLTSMPVDSPQYQSWLRLKEQHLSSRALPQDPLLTKGKNIRGGEFEGLKRSILQSIGLEAKKVNQLKNWSSVIDEFFKQQILLGPLRFGDMISADLIWASELIAAAKQEQALEITRNGGDPTKIELKLEQLNLDKIKPASIVASLGVMDETINASKNSRRGYNLAHPNAIINLLTVFSGHRLAVAMNVGQKMRNVVDLSVSRDFRDPMMADSLRTIFSTVAQSVVFTSMKAAVVGLMARGIYLALTPKEDEDRHWLFGKLEKEEIEKLRKTISDTTEQSFGKEAVFNGIFRDAVGSMHWAFSFGGLDNWFMMGIDQQNREVFKKSKEENIAQLNKLMRERFSELTPEQIADIRNQIEVIESNKFVPLGFEDFGKLEVGGGFGLAIQPFEDIVSDIGEIAIENKDFSVEELMLVGRLLGYAQPEVTRYLKMSSKLKDQLADMRQEEQPEEAIDFGF